MSQTDTFFQAFLDGFRQVLSQCTSTPWNGAFAVSPDMANLIWVNASATGRLSGDFAFGFTPGTGIALAQALTMADQAPPQYGEEEKEAATELLRQVCGICATKLAVDGGQPSLAVQGDATLTRPPAEQRLLELDSESRRVSIMVAITSELEQSLQPAANSAITATDSPSETDSPALHSALASRNLDLLLDVRLGVRLRFGSRRMKLREILEFHAGTIVELDRQVQEPVDLLVDNKLIARGEVVVVDGNYGLKVNEVLPPKECVEALY